MRLFIYLFSALLITFQGTAQSKNWGVWKELPKHGAGITFLHSHQKRLFVGDKNGRVYVYRVDGQGYRKIHLFEAHAGEVSHIEVSPSGDLLATAGYDGWVRLYDTKDFLLVKEFKNAKVEDYDGTKGLESTFSAFSKDGKQLYIGGYNRHVVAVDLYKETSETVFFDSTYAITCGEHIPSKNTLAFGYGGEVRFVNTKTGKLTNIVVGRHGAYDDYVCEVAYIPNRNWLSVWLVSGDIRFYNFQNKKLMMSLDASNRQGSCRIGVANTGNLIATGNANPVSLYNLKTGLKQQLLSYHKHIVSHAEFMVSDQLLATGDDKGKVVLWRKGWAKVKDDEVVVKGIPSRFKVGEVFVLEDLQFDQSSYALRVDAKKELDKLKGILKKYPTMEIALEGHTSNEGDAAKNMTLSRHRLESARNYLISKGIDPDRVMVKAFGETKPRADNATIVGRIANRRIEMRILKL